MGTKGWSDCHGRIVGLDGKTIWTYEGQGDLSPYVQEHVDLVTSIRTEEPFNEAATTAESTLVAIMGRISAYTGREVTWEQMMGSDLRIGPETYALGPVEGDFPVPVPGA
jgi:hypothetical protein